jgi:hypothetical protein
MSVEFFPCNLCVETICDSGPNFDCASCGEEVCKDCYSQQEKKYGVSKNQEDLDHYGDDVLSECDSCSKQTLYARIEEKKKELEELQAKK